MTEAFVTISFQTVVGSGVCVAMHVLVHLDFECKCSLADSTFEVTILVGISMQFVRSRSEEKLSAVFALEFMVT